MDTKKTILVSVLSTLGTMLIVAMIMHMCCGNCGKKTRCSKDSTQCSQSYGDACESSSSCTAYSKKCHAKKSCKYSSKSCAKGSSHKKCCKGDNKSCSKYSKDGKKIKIIKKEIKVDKEE
ncbi:MAG: hypothetical protein COA97_10810 [Flavobacteriales bacterium]|nr:MAG: hypothetical protein COA97_10810 [Flavobacteriales bacterium]